MESIVVVKQQINGGEVTTLSPIPLSHHELIAPIAKENPALSAINVSVNGVEIKDSQAFLRAYLNHKDDELLFTIETEEKAMSYMDTAVQSQYNDMVGKFQQMMNTKPEEIEEKKEDTLSIPMSNGIPTKEGLLIVVRDMASQARQLIFENSVKFMAKRQEFYKQDEEKYREVVMQQLQFNDMIIMSITSQTCGKFSVSPQMFDAAAQMYSGDPEVREALEGLAVESLQSSGEIPEDLTVDKLKEVLGSSCDFIEQYLNVNPQIHPMEVIMLKMREADEIKLQYGYDELQISTAINTYNIETSPEFADLRERLNSLTQKLFSSAPPPGGPGGPPGMMPPGPGGPGGPSGPMIPPGLGGILQ